MRLLQGVSLQGYSRPASLQDLQGSSTGQPLLGQSSSSGSSGSSSSGMQVDWLTLPA
jgi:hypothetical protein